MKKTEDWKDSVAYYAPYIPLFLSDRFIRGSQAPLAEMSLFHKRIRSWLFWVNFLFFQWFFVRFAREVTIDHKTTTGYALVGIVVPLTGWWNDYWYLWHIKNISLKRYKEGYKIMSTKLFLKVFFRRLRFAFRLKEIWKWEYENCRRCGINYRLPIGIEDSIWIKVNGRLGGCLCVNCFLILANKKGIRIEKDHFVRMGVFNPERDGPCYDLIGDWQFKLKKSLERKVME